MIARIARKEFTETLRDGRFRLVALTVLVLLLVSVLVSRNYYQTVSRQHESARQVAREHWENQGEKNPHSAAHFGTYAFKPAYPLSIVDNGLDKFLGVSLFLEAHRQNEAQFKAIEDSNALARFGELTPTFVLLYLVPLLIIMVAYGSFSGEKENGTLGLLLSHGISRRQLALGKIAGTWLVLLLLTAPVFGIGLLFLGTSTGVSTEEFSRYGLIVLTFLLYFGIFIHVSVLVSALARRSGLALIGLLGFWIVSCLLVPRATTNLAKGLYPSPSAVAYNKALKADLESGVDGHAPYSEFSKKFEQATLEQYGVDSVHQLPFNYWGLLMQEGEKHEKVVYDKHMRAIHDLYRNQLAVHRASAFLSPTILARMLSMSFARTDLEAHFHFQQEAEDYRIRLVGDLNDDLRDNFAYDDWDTKRDNAFFKTNVRFDYRPLPLATTVQQAQANFWRLGLWFAASLLLALLAAARMPIL
jgi:ABC-2 type transport system permease protein